MNAPHYRKYIVYLILIVGLYLVYYFSPLSKQPTIEAIKSDIVVSGDCTSGLSQLSRFLKSSPQSVEGWYWQGICQYRTGNFDDAQISFGEALRLDPSETKANKYLQLVSSEQSNVSAYTQSLSEKKIFESYLGFTPDPQFMEFKKVFLRKTSGGEFASGEYINKKTFGETVEYLATTLKATKSLIVQSKTKGVFSVSFSNNKSKSYVIVVPNDSTPIVVTYTNNK